MVCCERKQWASAISSALAIADFGADIGTSIDWFEEEALQMKKSVMCSLYLVGET
jgi:hypothetical protein